MNINSNMEWKYKRPVATLSKISGKCPVTTDVLNYSKHRDINKISGLQCDKKISDILEYCYLADALQLSDLKNEIVHIINEKMENHSGYKDILVEKKTGTIYKYRSKYFNIEYDCNCEKILDIFGDILENMHTELLEYDNGDNSIKVYIYNVKYLQSLITEYLMYRRDRVKTIDTIYTIYIYVSNGMELYTKKTPEIDEGINIDNVEYLLDIVDPIYRSKIINMICIDNWDVDDRWKTVKKLDHICNKYNLRHVFFNKIKFYVSRLHENDHIHSKL